jgi:hypothetical protein
MAYLNTRRFGTPLHMDVYLKGGVFGSLKLKPKHLGLHGKTLVFTSPAAATVTFDDPTGAGLSPKDILDQIGAEVDGAAATTEGTTAMSAITMASETLTVAIDGGADVPILFGTESGEVAILAVANAVLNPLGVTASAGGGTPGGIVLTTDEGGPAKSIQVKAAGGGQAKLTMAVETQTGSDSIRTRFHDGRLELVEAIPTSGVGIDGAASTAAAYFGFGNTTVAGTVYAAPDGSAPRFIAATPSGQGDGIIVTTEEA